MTEPKALCVGGKCYCHRVGVRQLASPFNLLAWLQAQTSFPKVYWEGRDGVRVAAIGSELMLHEVPHFDKGNISSARFWGGHAFFPSKPPKDRLWGDFPRCAFFIPRLELIQEGETTTAIQHTINRCSDEQSQIIPCDFDQREVTGASANHLPEEKRWHEMVEEALKHIGENLFQKVVLARRSTYHFDQALAPYQMLNRVDAESATRFALQFTSMSAFIGATPERLYLREGAHLLTEALAGTRPISSSKSALFNSPKDRWEFDLVKKSIHNSLAPLCHSVRSDEEDRVISTSKTHHLYNAFHCLLKEDADDDKILKALHPTAAMGGLPKEDALKYLETHEPFERGWYASALGYIGQHKAEFCVGIRSALVAQNTLHLFAGTGIVQGSVPKSEWEELEHKTSLWREG